jgi:hypothetical protein
MLKVAASIITGNPMRLRPLIPLALALGSAPFALAQAPSLTCPQSPTGRPCDTIHYHVAMYRPDTRAFTELFGINQFASQSACDRARDAAVKRNEDLVAFFRQKDQQYPPDRFGPCHCDLTIDKSSPNFLNDLQRIAQVRLAEEIRLRVRERLLDRSVPTDSELMRGLNPPPTFTPLLGGPRLVAPPAVQPAAAANAPNELRMTKATESTASTASMSVDLPLVEVQPGAAPTAPATIVPPPTPAPAARELPEERVATDASAAAPAPTPAPALATTPIPAPAPASNPAPAPAPPSPEPQPQPQATPTQPASAPPTVAPAEAAPQPAEESAEAFVGYEGERVQNVLKASGAISDEAIRSKIFEACMQRIQLLSNLRSLIAGSGTGSRFATAVRGVNSEADRLTLVAKLFGSDMPKHWAPEDAKDVILDARPDVESDPERVLRDAGSHWSPQQKKRALYVILARTQPTEQQQLWLGSVIDAFLQ